MCCFSSQRSNQQLLLPPVQQLPPQRLQRQHGEDPGPPGGATHLYPARTQGDATEQLTTSCGSISGSTFITTCAMHSLCNTMMGKKHTANRMRSVAYVRSNTSKIEKRLAPALCGTKIKSVHITVHIPGCCTHSGLLAGWRPVCLWGGR